MQQKKKRGRGVKKELPKSDQEIIELAAEYEFDPQGYADVFFPWGLGELKGLAGPRVWQDDILGEITKHLSDPTTRFEPLQIAVASGHGIGKSALMGMISNWALTCFRDAKILCTANTEPQLRTKTAPEVSKWFRMSLSSHFFNIHTTNISSKEKTTSNWRMDFVSWSKDNTEAFAGLHNKGKIVVLLFDEGSNIHDKVWEVAEGALTDEDTVIIWVVFGNPTRNTGRFKECFGKFRHRWITRQIDSRTVEGTNKKLFGEWAKDRGEDSDFFKIRVRGIFPTRAERQFIEEDLVDKAMEREGASNISDPLIMGVDVAGDGNDADEQVLSFRKGLDAKTIPQLVFHGLDAMQLAGEIVKHAKGSPHTHGEACDAVFIDAGGLGWGVISAVRQLGIDCVGVDFGGKPSNKTTYGNKATEMLGNIRDLLREGLAIPDDPVLKQQLIVREYDFDKHNRYVLESKDVLKERGEDSPDRSDSLKLTTAFPVAPKEMRETNTNAATNGYADGSYQAADGWDPNS
jgi:hypothetical protein